MGSSRCRASASARQLAPRLPPSTSRYSRMTGQADSRTAVMADGMNGDIRSSPWFEWPFQGHRVVGRMREVPAEAVGEIAGDRPPARRAFDPPHHGGIPYDGNGTQPYGNVWIPEAWTNGRRA